MRDRIASLFSAAAALAVPALSSAQTYVQYDATLDVGPDGFTQDVHEGEVPDRLAHASLDMPGYACGDATANVGPSVDKAAMRRSRAARAAVAILRSPTIRLGPPHTGGGGGPKRWGKPPSP